MFTFTSLTNTKPAKDLGTKIITAPTKGQIKVTPKAAEVLDVRDDSYLQIVKGGDGKLYAVKGSEDKKEGGRLASANKTGAGTLTFSSANAWQEMKGNEDNNVHYTLNAESFVEFEDRKFFELTFEKEVAKAKRKEKVAKNEVYTETEAVEEAAETDTTDTDTTNSTSPFDTM